MSHDFKLIVFDWDGTLMDSEARIVACIRAAGRDLGMPDREDDEIKNIIGLGLAEALNTLSPGASREVHEGMFQRYRHHYLVGDVTPSALFAGSRDTLDALEAAGYLLAVATGKGRAGLDMVLEETGLQNFFAATRTADETRSKPHPQMLEELIDYFGVEPHETLMVGDTEYDLQMAHNARAHALAVSYGVHEVERLLAQQPLGCLDAIEELEPWLAARRAA